MSYTIELIKKEIGKCQKEMDEIQMNIQHQQKQMEICVQEKHIIKEKVEELRANLYKLENEV